MLQINLHEKKECLQPSAPSSFVCPLINDVIGKIEALGNIYVETIGKLFCVGEV